MSRGGLRFASLLLLLICAVPWGAHAARVVVEWEFEYVNVRAAPDTGGDPLGRLGTGAEAEVLESRGEWSRVRFAGGEGWVVSRSLRALPEAPAQTPAGVEVALPVTAPPPPPPTVAVPQESPAPPAPKPPAEPPAAAPSPPAETGERPGGYLSQYTADSDLPAFNPGSSVVSAFSGLLIVLALIAGAVFLVRKLLGSRFPSARRPGGIRVLASRPVAPRQSLLLVEVEGLVWLLAQGPEGTRLIAPVEDERALQRLDDRYEFLETPFQSELRRTLDVEGQGEAEADAPGSDTEAGAGGAGEPTREQRLAALRRRSKPADGA